ncbi:MAG: DNA topoisomerase IB [Gluconacetobacter diazotrophicus]|nr:DNA topoisomerase IB [Gluconacetobacter diazotrophicus]
MAGVATRDGDSGLGPREAARAARLHYVDPGKPGFTRRKTGTGFAYADADGRKVSDTGVIERLRKLAIPPAYTDVWICPDPRGHLQAVGRDTRGRKQYRYHADWRAVRDEAKYGKMALFADKLPALRRQVAKDLALPGLPRAKVLATAVALLEKTMMRVGNDEYAKTNKSYGITTLKNRHATVKGATLVLDFRAKHGVQQHVEVKDRRLAGIIRKLQDLTGQELFQYVGEDGERHDVSSGDVNEYLREVTGEEITAKDFRTWAATNLAALALQEFERFDSEAVAKKTMLRVIETVAKTLGNTPAICRKCYIHPRIFEGYLDGTLADALKGRAEAVLEEGDGLGLSAEEVAVVAFLGRTLGEVVEQGGRKTGASAARRARAR